MIMRASDMANSAAKAIVAQPIRAMLIVISMSIGIAAVVVLTSLGESARQYIADQFRSLGTNLLIVLPGRSETIGGQPPLFGETPRDLTLDDSLALLRSTYIAKIAPITIGSAPVSWAGRERESLIMGSTAALKSIRHLQVAQGRFLPEIKPDRALAACVIGQQLRDQIFGYKQALGQWLRIGDRRFRVIGILSSEGQSIGVDFDEIAIIPVASASALFNSPSLFRILAEAKTLEVVSKATEDIREMIKIRHEGEDDVTIISQDSVMTTFDEILNAITLSVASIAAISLVVAGILIMNVMLVSVSQRIAEIGLLKALGATSVDIKLLFLSESAMLSLLGAVTGLFISLIVMWGLQRYYADFDWLVPIWAAGLAIAVSIATGVIFGVIPALRAAKLNPIEALSKR